VVPGAYQVEFSAGATRQTAPLSIVRDKRLGTTAEDYARQFGLLSELSDSLSALNLAVNRIRRMKRQLAVLGERDAGLAGKAADCAGMLAAIEAVLVDVNRQSSRDVLRNPAGLNDTLVDLINTVSISDTAPTAQAEAVSRALMAAVASQLARLDAVVAGEVAEVNRLAAPVASVVG